MWRSRSTKASRPPADPPTATTGKGVLIEAPAASPVFVCGASAGVDVVRLGGDDFALPARDVFVPLGGDDFALPCFRFLAMDIRGCCAHCRSGAVILLG